MVVRKTKVASSRHVYIRPRKLDETAWPRLAKLLGAPISPELREKIESHVTLGVDGKKHGNPPSPADYVREFRLLWNEVFGLSNKLASWSYYYTDEFARHGADFYAIERALFEAMRVAGAVVHGNQGKRTGGRPDNWPLNSAAVLLESLFEQHYKGPIRGRRTKEIEFVHLALQAGGAIVEDSAAIKAILDRRAKGGAKPPGEK